MTAVGYYFEYQYSYQYQQSLHYLHSQLRSANQKASQFIHSKWSAGPGGKASNQSVAAARKGVDVTFISKLGCDDFANLALKTWADAGVTAHVEQIRDSYTGAAYIFIDDATGENAVIIAPGAAASLSADDMDKAAGAIRSASVFITQLEQAMPAAHPASSIARDAGFVTIFNPAPAAELADDMLALCDYLTPNENDRSVDLVSKLIGKL